MSAIKSIPYPDYPGNKKHYKMAASKFETNSRLVLYNSRFLSEVDSLRKKFNIEATGTQDVNFIPRPYVEKPNDKNTEPIEKHDDSSFDEAVHKIASRIPLDGDMFGFVKEYVLHVPG
ncbi:hypothetical protein BH23PAT2_BH23PAT2_00140 [soil metagenome]